jgi:hypothetical protein
MRTFCTSIVPLIYKHHVNASDCTYSKVRYIGTDMLLGGKEVALGERVCFGNDGDDIDTCTETLHDLNVEQLETKQGQMRPNEPYEERTYGR